MTNELSFEEAIARLDGIVRLLEKGDAPLNESLALFEESAALVKSCKEMLDKAEQAVVRLKKGEDGEPEELPFEEAGA
jgi:exodeoxyribonuclease VII small subunit